MSEPDTSTPAELSRGLGRYVGLRLAAALFALAAGIAAVVIAILLVRSALS
jgi:hypothetical protein